MNDSSAILEMNRLYLWDACAVCGVWCTVYTETDTATATDTDTDTDTVWCAVCGVWCVQYNNEQNLLLREID